MGADHGEGNSWDGRLPREQALKKSAVKINCLHSKVTLKEFLPSLPLDLEKCVQESKHRVKVVVRLLNFKAFFKVTFLYILKVNV